MSKASNRIVFIIGLLGVTLLSGCGVTSTKLPSNLQTGGGGYLSIVTTQFPDAISGRSYYLVISTTGGSGALSSCSVVSGALPTGLSWSVSPIQPSNCILSGSAVGAAGPYTIVMQATDTSSPPKTDQLPYTLTVRNDFSICAGPSSAVVPCLASSPSAVTTSFPDAVQGRSYGVTPLSQIIQTNLNGSADASPVGHGSEFGNGPFIASSSSITGLPGGITTTPQVSQSNYVLSGTAVTGAPNSYTVTVSITDSPICVPNQSCSNFPVVPARTYTKTYVHVVHAPITLAQSFGTQWPDAVHGRPYGSGNSCTGGACAPAVYSATNGLGGYVWPSTIPSSLASITGMSCPAVATGSTTFTCSATDITAGSSVPGGTPTSYSPNVVVSDTANTATPAATVTTDPASTRTDTLWVDAPLQATLVQNGNTNPPNLIPGVAGRSYGIVGAPPTYSAAGGLGSRNVSTYEWCVNTGAASLPAGLGGIGTSCAPSFTTTGAATESLTAANISSTITPPSQTFSITVELDDTGNAATSSSASTRTSATNATTLVMNAPLALQLTQATNPTPNTLLLPAVTNRSYGGVGAPKYTASYGLGGYVFPASPGPYPAGFACSSGSNFYTCSANTAVAVSPGTYSSLGVTVTDSANPAVPQGAATSTTNLLVDPQITVSTNQSPTPWPDAVHGRAYGLGTGCTGGGCTPMTYTAAGGLGASGGYTFINITGFPAGLNCNNVSPTLTCSAAAITFPAATFHPLVTAVDVANAATPAATVSTDPGSVRPSTDTLTVDPPLSVSLTQLVPGLSSNPLALLPAVANRSYGVINAGAAAPTYAAAGGLGATNVATYEWCINTGSASIPAGLTGIGTSCSAFTTTGAATAKLSANPISSSVTPGNFNFTVELDDTGNVSVPSSVSTASATSATYNSQLQVIAPLAVNTNLSNNPFPDSVLNRAYGTGVGCSGGNCTPITFTASNGIFPYSYNAISTSDTSGTGLWPTGFACAPAAPINSAVFTCSASSVALSVTPGGFAPGVTVTDTGNYATPIGSLTTSTSLNVDPQLSVSVSIGNASYPAASPWPAGVTLRPYGTGSGCATGATCVPPIFTATGGLGAVGGYSFSNYALLTGAGFVCTPTSLHLTCSSTSVTGGAGSYSPSVTATDNANVSTPPSTTTTDPASVLTGSLAVNADLSIQNAFLENGAVGQPYSATFSVVGQGVGAPYLWCAGTISGNSCTPSGGISGVSFITPNPAFSDDPAGDIRGYYQGNPTTSGAAPTTVEVADRGNSTTPACATTATCPSLAFTGANSPKILKSQGFVAGNFSDSLVLIDPTLTSSSVTNVALDNPVAANAPETPRVTPDGNWVYVTKSGNSTVSVYDPLGVYNLSHFAIANAGVGNPSALEIEPQQHFTSIPSALSCTAVAPTTACSNLEPYVRYDAWLVDPVAGAVEPIPDAENPGVIPSTLAGANSLSVAKANSIAITPDAVQAWVGSLVSPPCNATPTVCNTLTPLTLPQLSPTTATSYPAVAGSTFGNIGLSAGAAVADPRGLYVYTVETNAYETKQYIAITLTDVDGAPNILGYLPNGAFPYALPTYSVCQTGAGATVSGMAVSPDGNRLLILCQDDPANYVEVWDVSQSDGASLNVDHTLTAPVVSIALPVSNSTSNGGGSIAENGCTTPVDVRAQLTTSAYGMRLFVTCQNSDTVVPIEYNSGSGSNTLDGYSVDAVISTDSSSIANAASGAYVNACHQGGSSCPSALDLTPNPPLHFATGGYAPAISPVALPKENSGTAYYQYVVVGGGTLPRTWSNPDNVLTTDSNCAGLSLNTSTGQITGTALQSSVTCGGANGFIIRVADGSGQVVERAFTIPIQ